LKILTLLNEIQDSNELELRLVDDDVETDESGRERGEMREREGEREMTVRGRNEIQLQK